MNEINGIPMVAKMNEQLNIHFSQQGKEKFTDTLEELYEPLSNPETSNKFLSAAELSKEDTPKCLVINIFNRFQLLNTLLSLFQKDLFKAFLSDNKFRIQLITKGVRVKVVNNELISYSYKKYIFPHEEMNVEPEIDEEDVLCIGKVSDNTENGQTVFEWPGCSLVLPRNYNIFTVPNPEITFPSFIINNREKKKMVGLYETNWGVNILQSENAMVSVSVDGEEPVKEMALQKSYSNALKKEESDFFSITVFLSKNVLSEDGNEFTIELPLNTPRQDILMKITDEEQEETPMLWTMTT